MKILRFCSSSFTRTVLPQFEALLLELVYLLNSQDDQADAIGFGLSQHPLDSSHKLNLERLQLLADMMGCTSNFLFYDEK